MPQGRAVLDVWMSHGDRVAELPGWLCRHRGIRELAVRRHER